MEKSRETFQLLFRHSKKGLVICSESAPLNDKCIPLLKCRESGVRLLGVYEDGGNIIRYYVTAAYT